MLLRKTQDKKGGERDPWQGIADRIGKAIGAQPD